MKSSPTHVLYSGKDKDAPDAIKDRNGVIVLGLCKICGRAEIELSEPCDRGLALSSHHGATP
jgi:hypothetical protein